MEVRSALKKFIGGFFRHFFSNPILPLLVIICSVLVMFLTSGGHRSKSETEKLESIKAVQAVRMSTIYSTAATTSTTSTTTTSIETTTTVSADESAPTSGEVSVEAGGSNVPVPAAPHSDTATEAAPQQPDTQSPAPSLTDYTVYAGAQSPNAAFYQERLTIFGDSIASGFKAYGYIPTGHNIAAESMALWNMNIKEEYKFDLGGGPMWPVDAAIYSNSSLIYISIGMNDILGMTTDTYAAKICDIAQQLVNNIPDTTVVVGSITPVSANNNYTTNATLDGFNYALETAVSNLGSPRLLSFTASSPLKEPFTAALYSSYGGGDGLHLNGSTYGYWLDALYSYLDTTETKSRIEKREDIAQ